MTRIFSLTPQDSALCFRAELFKGPCDEKKLLLALKLIPVPASRDGPKSRIKVKVWVRCVLSHKLIGFESLSPFILPPYVAQQAGFRVKLFFLPQALSPI